MLSERVPRWLPSWSVLTAFTVVPSAMLVNPSESGATKPKERFKCPSKPNCTRDIPTLTVEIFPVVEETKEEA